MACARALGVLLALFPLARAVFQPNFTYNVTLSHHDPLIDFESGFGNMEEEGITAETAMARLMSHRVYSKGIEIYGQDSPDPGNPDQSGMIGVIYDDLETGETKAGEKATTNRTEAYLAALYVDEPGLNSYRFGPNAGARITGAKLLLQLEAQASQQGDMETSVQHWVSGGRRNEFFKNKGLWEVTGNTMWSSKAQQGFTEFEIPKNTSMFMINGTIGDGLGSMEVRLAPPGPGSNAPRLSRLNETDVEKLPSNGMIYLCVLDPKVHYNVSIMTQLFNGTGSSAASIGFESATFYSGLSDKAKVSESGADAKAGSSGGGLSGGAIAGIVIGSVAGVAIVALLTWCLARSCKRRKAEGDRRTDSPDFTVDEDQEINPYQALEEGRSRDAKGRLEATAARRFNRESRSLSPLPPPPLQIPMQEVDAGAVPVDSVPPQYDESWASPQSNSSGPSSAVTPTTTGRSAGSILNSPGTNSTQPSPKKPTSSSGQTFLASLKTQYKRVFAPELDPTPQDTEQEHVASATRRVSAPLEAEYKEAFPSPTSATNRTEAPGTATQESLPLEVEYKEAFPDPTSTTNGTEAPGTATQNSSRLELEYKEVFQDPK